MRTHIVDSIEKSATEISEVSTFETFNNMGTKTECYNRLDWRCNCSKLDWQCKEISSAQEKKNKKHEYQKAFHNKSWLIDKHIHLQLSWLSLYHFFSKKRFFSFKFSMIKAKLINFFPQAKQLNDIDFLLLTVVVFFFK